MGFENFTIERPPVSANSLMGPHVGPCWGGSSPIRPGPRTTYPAYPRPHEWVPDSPVMMARSWTDLGFIFNSPAPLYLAGRRDPGKNDSDWYWGSADGFKLVRMKKEWLSDVCQEYYDQGDGEWFVTMCVCAGMELEYAVALRSVIIRHLGLAELNGSETIDDAFQKEVCTKWNWEVVRQLTIDISKSEAPLPDMQLGRWVQNETLPSGLRKYYQNGHCNYRYLIPLERQIQQGLHLAQENKSKEAMELFDELLAMNPNNDGIKDGQIKALIQEGSFLIDQGNPKEAVQHFRALLKTHPDNTDVLFGHAKAQVAYAEMVSHKQKIKLLEKAKADLTTVTEQDDLHEEAFTLLDEVENKLNRLSLSPSPGSTPPLTPAASISSGSEENVTPNPPTSPRAATLSITRITWNSLQLGSEKGRGGFGVVYQGTYEGALVAIKQLHLNRLSDKDFQQFELEMTVMESLRFPNIVSFYGACLEENHYAIVMEYCPTSLYYQLHSNHPPNDAQSLRIAVDIGKGLNYLHSLNPFILHRDLKSQNVLIDENGKVKLTDFGFAKIKDTTKSTTELAESSVGTVGWMAPEIMGLEPDYSTPSDVYAYAIVLLEIASRKIPFAGVASAIIQTEINAGRRPKIPDNCSVEVAALIVRCWAQNPSERPSAKSAYQTLEKVSQFFKSEPVQTTDPRPSYMSNDERTMFSS